MVDAVEILSLAIENIFSFLSSWPGALIFLVIFFRKDLGALRKDLGARFGGLRGLARKSREVFSEFGVGASGVNLKFREIKTIDTAIGETNVSILYSREFKENYCTFSSGTFRFQISWPIKSFTSVVEPDQIEEYTRRMGLPDDLREGIRLFLFNKDSVDNSFIENINIFTHQVSNDLTIDQYMAQTLQALPIRDFEIASVDERNSAAVVQYPLPYDGVQITCSQRLVINNGIAYQATVTQRTSSLTNFVKQQVYRDILNSFKLLRSDEKESC